MSESSDAQPEGDAAGEPTAPDRASEKRFRRTMLSTGFSASAGKTCEVCGFQGFRWQTECPQGHPLA